MPQTVLSRSEQKLLSALHQQRRVNLSRRRDRELLLSITADPDTLIKRMVAKGWRHALGGGQFVRAESGEEAAEQSAPVQLLLDARIELKSSDETVMALLDQAAVTFQIVLTKADDLKPAALERKEAEAARLARAHPAAVHGVITTSSQTGQGIPELRAEVAGLVAG